MTVKVYDEVWTVISAREKDDMYYNEEDDLAYLCQVSKDVGFETKQGTGRRWAESRSYDRETKEWGETKQGKETIYKNTPISGFKLGKSIERYSTSNKLIRLHDPRGFTVEISISCLASLLEDVTVVKGVIQDECVWGRQGTQNILLSINSQEYKDSFNAGDGKKIKYLSAKEIKPGDIVKISYQGEVSEMCYIGHKKIKVRVDNLVPWKDGDDWNRQNREVVSSFEATGTKKTYIFVATKPYTWNNKKFSHLQVAKPNVIKVLDNDITKMKNFDVESCWERHLPNEPLFRNDVNVVNLDIVD